MEGQNQSQLPAGEQWAAIAGYEGFYEISSHGRVRALERTFHTKCGLTRRGARIIKPWPEKDDYLAVYLCRSGSKQKFKVHRLVAKAFLQNPGNLPVVHHKDGNPANNTLSNLEWTDAKGNIQKALSVGTQFGVQGEMNCGAKLNWSAVRFIRSYYETGGLTVRELAASFKISTTAIREVVKYRSWRELGFISFIEV